jgi:predicted nucleotidyltransferase
MATTEKTLPLFRSAAQARLLTYLFVTGADRPMNLSALSERTGIPLSTLQREVSQLERAGLLSSERIGNTRLVFPNEESPYFTDLQSLLVKAFGPATLLASLFRRIPRIEAAFIYGSWARRYRGDDVPAPRDLDVVVIGDPRANAVYAAARRAENELDIEVNPILVAPEEWDAPRGLVKRIQAGPIVEIPLNAT